MGSFRAPFKPQSPLRAALQGSRPGRVEWQTDGVLLRRCPAFRAGQHQLDPGPSDQNSSMFRRRASGQRDEILHQFFAGPVIGGSIGAPSSGFRHGFRRLSCVGEGTMVLWNAGGGVPPGVVPTVDLALGSRDGRRPARAAGGSASGRGFSTQRRGPGIDAGGPFRLDVSSGQGENKDENFMPPGRPGAAGGPRRRRGDVARTAVWQDGTRLGQVSAAKPMGARVPQRKNRFFLGGNRLFATETASDVGLG